MPDFQEKDDKKRMEELAQQGEMVKLKTSEDIQDYLRLYQNKWELCVIPVSNKEGERVPLIKWQEFQKRKPTTEEVDRWFRKDYLGCNVSIVCGGISNNLAAIDVDDAEFIEKFKTTLPDCPVIQTKKGAHFWVLTFRPVKTFSIQNESGGELLSLRGEGASVTAPPSFHWQDKTIRYKFINLPARIPTYWGDLEKLCYTITGVEKKAKVGQAYGMDRRYREVIRFIQARFGEKNGG